MPFLTEHTFSILLTFTNVILQFDLADDKMVNSTENGDPATCLFARSSSDLYKPSFSWFRAKVRGGRAPVERKLGTCTQ